MGMTYEELDTFGRLRKIDKCGPVSMFERLLITWQDRFTPREIAVKVKRFFTYYAINRHKATVLTPSYHAEIYGVDDNRFDLRQFLYDVSWETQYKEIDSIVELLENNGKPKL
jgi:NAD+ synthase (glutamine-hydrolysing)